MHTWITIFGEVRLFFHVEGIKMVQKAAIRFFFIKLNKTAAETFDLMPGTS
jgi:hypothetical protein